MKQDIIHALDILLEISEKYYPKYHSCDNIAWVEDLYKKIKGDES
jgi:hypothetical protein